MADLIGPFDTAPWSQTEWLSFAPTWAPSGIIGTGAASIGTGDFAVTASGLTLTVAANGKRAWIDGSGYKPDTNKAITVAANTNVSLSRRDRLVIRRDAAAKTITVVRLEGTPASTPAAPDLAQNTGAVYELPICSFLVPPNSGTTLSGFVDERRWLQSDGSAGRLHGVELHSAITTAVGSGTVSGLGFPPGSAIVDTDGYFTGPDSLDILTIPAGLGGPYLVSHRVQLSSVSAGRFFADANTVAGGNKVSRGLGTGDDVAQSSRVMRLAAGDVFKLNVFHERGSITDVISRSLSLHLIGT